MVAANLRHIIPAFCEIADSSLLLVVHKGRPQSFELALAAVLSTRLFDQFFHGIWRH
jgi:hypothetical protein